MKEMPVLLLVHGSWHGPWCFEPLIVELDRLGVRSATVGLPSVGTDIATMGSMAEDAAAIEAAAADIGSDVIVVAHSYGGVPTTEARLGDNVRHIVFIGAFMPDVGGSLVSLLPPGPLPPFVVAHEDGTTSVEPDHAVAALYADVAPDVASWAMERLLKHSVKAITAPVTHASWRDVPSTYVLLTEDFGCPTIVQQQVRHQATETLEVEGAHFPFLAKPPFVAAMLRNIAGRYATGTERAVS